MAMGNRTCTSVTCTSVWRGVRGSDRGHRQEDRQGRIHQAGLGAGVSHGMRHAHRVHSTTRTRAGAGTAAGRSSEGGGDAAAHQHALSTAAQVVVEAAVVVLGGLLVGSAHLAQVQHPIRPPRVARVAGS